MVEDQAPVNFSAPTLPRIHTSSPAVYLRHNISDDELSMLCETRKDFTQEIMWACVGVFFGSAPTAIITLAAYLKDSAAYAIKPENLLHIILFTAGLVGFAISGWVSFNRSKRAKSLEEQIRDRANSA